MKDKDRKSIVYRKRRYAVDFSFNSVMDCMSYLNDECLEEADKADLCAWRLFRRRIPARRQAEMVVAVFDAIKPQRKAGETQVMDIEQDFALIKAGFRQAYSIDLSEECGRLHWLDFLDYLGAIPKDTKLAEVINIRTMPLPKPTKENAEYRAAVLRAKEAVRLRRKKQDGEQHIASQFSALFDALKEKAK